MLYAETTYQKIILEKNTQMFRYERKSTDLKRDYVGQCDLN